MRNVISYSDTPTRLFFGCQSFFSREITESSKHENQDIDRPLQGVTFNAMCILKIVVTKNE
jgi:hypothetical protein